MAGQHSGPSSARWLRAAAAIAPYELKAVILSMLYFFFLFGSYAIVKPVRDTMGTVYGMERIQELLTATFAASFVFAPLYGLLASRLKLAALLPWVYGFVAITVLAFYLLFSAGWYRERWLAAAFYVWVSTFNVLIISVFWSFMADTFAPAQAKRLFGLIAAGGTLGSIAGPALALFLGQRVGNEGLMLISAAGFLVTALLVRVLAHEKYKLRVSAAEAQRTSLDRRLGRNPLEGFALLVRSGYLRSLALFVLLMTFISTIVYVQLGDLITHAYSSPVARTHAYAAIELWVNGITVLIQLLGTGRLIARFGMKFALLLNPVIMVCAFLAIAFSPVLLLLGSMQIVRRVAEYAVAKPAREMLFTVVDQESRYKAKNVIDTVVYRFGDVSAGWVSALIHPYGVTGLALLGVLVTLFWFPVALVLAQQYRMRRQP
jgi:AAA family ATP:ADP antiporter